MQDASADQQSSPTAQGDVSTALVNGKSNQAKLIRVSAEAAQKKNSPAKRIPATASISTKTKKSDAAAKDKSPVVKESIKKNRTSNVSKAQRRAA
jgi:hypothetical protein